MPLLEKRLELVDFEDLFGGMGFRVQIGDLRRSYVTVLDFPLSYRSSNVVGGFRCMEVMKIRFSAKQGT